MTKSEKAEIVKCKWCEDGNIPTIRKETGELVHNIVRKINEKTSQVTHTLCLKDYNVEPSFSNPISYKGN